MAFLASKLCIHPHITDPFMTVMKAQVPEPKHPCGLSERSPNQCNQPPREARARSLTVPIAQAQRERGLFMRLRLASAAPAPIRKHARPPTRGSTHPRAGRV